MMKHWKSVWRYHISSIVNSGLYDECSIIYVGIVYRYNEDLKYFTSNIKRYKKIKIIHQRKYHDLPIRFWPEKNIKTWCQLGEGETILKMIKFAKKKYKSDYLFLHSKGVTLPSYGRRENVLKLLYDNGLNKNSSDKEKTDFILKFMTKDIVNGWEGKRKSLVNNGYYHFIWNFFWVKGSLLKKFNIKKFIIYMKGQKYKSYKLTRGRHWLANFPVNLYKMVNKNG